MSDQHNPVATALHGDIQDQISKMVIEELGKAPAEQLTPIGHFPHGGATRAQVNDSVVQKLDTEDRLILENFYLKQQLEQSQQRVEQMRKKLMDMMLERQKARIDGHFLKKYEIDPTTHSMVIEEETLKITPKPQAG